MAILRDRGQPSTSSVSTVNRLHSSKTSRNKRLRRSIAAWVCGERCSHAPQSARRGAYGAGKPRAGLGVEESPEERRLILMTSAVVTAKQGLFLEADAFVEQADAVHGARHLHFDEERAVIAMEKTATHGDWDGLLKIAEERLSVALRTGPTERIVEAARALARAAWYGNTTIASRPRHQIVKDCGFPPFDAIEAAAIDDLQAALGTADLERAAALLDRAIERIDRSENDFLRIVVRACAALLAPAQRRGSARGAHDCRRYRVGTASNLDRTPDRLTRAAGLRHLQAPCRSRRALAAFERATTGSSSTSSAVRCRQGSDGPTRLRPRPRAACRARALRCRHLEREARRGALALARPQGCRQRAQDVRFPDPRAGRRSASRFKTQEPVTCLASGSAATCASANAFCKRHAARVRSASRCANSCASCSMHGAIRSPRTQPNGNGSRPFSAYLAKLRSELGGLLAKDAVRRENGGAREAVAP